MAQQTDCQAQDGTFLERAVVSCGTLRCPASLTGPRLSVACLRPPVLRPGCVPVRSMNSKVSEMLKL